MLKMIGEFFAKFSKKKKHNIIDSVMDVYEFEDSDNLFVTMGISAERTAELSKIINENYVPGTNIINTMIAVSKLCKNRQELAICMFIIGSAQEKLRNPLFWEKYT